SVKIRLLGLLLLFLTTASGVFAFSSAKSHQAKPAISVEIALKAIDFASKNDISIDSEFSANLRRGIEFTGRRYSEITNQYFNRNRYYSPALGRFVSKDPLSFGGGHNLWRYSNNNPIRWLDPWGLIQECYIGPCTEPEYDERPEDRYQPTFFINLLAIYNPGVSLTPEDQQKKWEGTKILGELALTEISFAALEAFIGAGKFCEIDSLLGRGKTLGQSGNAARTLPNTTRGWKVGDPINNLTSANNVPTWNTVRARYWKNEAAANATNYSETNLARMQKGLAPQRINPTTGKIESMELHHAPAQRNGGLFDVQKVWPDDHAAIDPFRKTGN
ncbi:MAG: RHS repeat-associated core domain-containing protein, partial [Candidatus Riflebacteria bacterium]|nr:RHS repeat-associated core domain-containing protein [Candidatus Riflebacteria bacterium]